MLYSDVLIKCTVSFIPRFCYVQLSVGCSIRSPYCPRLRALHPSYALLAPPAPLQCTVAPLLSRTDASPSHFAILNVRRLFIEIQYLQVKLLPQMSATLHLSYFPDSPEPNAHPPILHLLAETSSRLKVSPACIQGATGCLHSPVKFHLQLVRMQCIPV